jgi:hypothetical protein
MTRLRWLLAAGIVLAASACSNPSPPFGSVEPPAPTGVLPSIGGSGIIGDPGGPISLRPPGQPFDADDILAAMEDSRRPGGVPDELQTADVATAVADVLWTLEGEPWETISAGGSCDASECTLELAGSGAAAAGHEDVWVLSIVPDSGEVEVVTADLHAVPSEAAAAMDRMARGAAGAGALDDLLLTSVRWQPPPDAGRFVLAYRSGDEEESCSMDVELDIETGTVTEVATSGC